MSGEVLTAAQGYSALLMFSLLKHPLLILPGNALDN